MGQSIKIMAAVAAAMLSAAAFGEQVDNPIYIAWAKYKPDTTVTLKQSSQMAMMPSMHPEVTLTQKLIEVKPESVTVEMTSKMMMAGQEMAAPAGAAPTKQVIPAKVEKGQEYLPPAAAGANAQIKDMKEGKETVEVKGNKVDAVTHEYTITMDLPANSGMTGTTTMRVKTWSSPEVPGGTVKSEQSGTVGQMGEVKSTTALVDYTVTK